MDNNIKSVENQIANVEQSAPATNNIAPLATRKIKTPDSRTRYYLLIGLIIAFIVALAGVGWFGMGRVIISPTPADAQITVNGKSFPANKLIRKIPKTLQIIIIKEGYIEYKKTVPLKFGGKVELQPALAELPTVTQIDSSANAPLTISSGIKIAIKAVSNDKKYLVKVLQNPQGEDRIQNLNVKALSGIESVQYPTNQKHALIIQKSEIGVLYFAKPDAVSQNYSKYPVDNITSIALSQDGKEVFYMQYDPNSKQHSLYRNNIAGDSADLYFDQALLTKLELSDPQLSWSSNGRYIMAVEKKIVLIDLIDRQARTISYNQDIINAHFTPDISYIIAQDSGNSLLAISLEGKVKTDKNTTADDKPFEIVNQGISIDFNQMYQGQDNQIYYFTSENGNNVLTDYSLVTQNKVKYILGDPILTTQVSAMAIDITNNLLYILSDNRLYSQSLVQENYE